MVDDENCMTERERFEAWMRREHPAKNSMDWTSLERDDERPDEYMMRFTWAAWSAWLARSKVPNAEITGRTLAQNEADGA